VAPRVQQNAPEDSAPEDLHSLNYRKRPWPMLGSQMKSQLRTKPRLQYAHPYSQCMGRVLAEVKKKMVIKNVKNTNL
jgi:hypothetical protein